MSFLQGKTKRCFLRSSGVRHRKWIRLGVKLPDFTVGMSSHCIIRGYSLSLASIKREGETRGGPDNITCVQYLLIKQFSAIHFANHFVLPVVYDRERFLVVCECRDSDQS